jgi:hypothetical protein
MKRAPLGCIALGSLLVLAPAAHAQGMPVIDTLGDMYHALEQSELVQQTANAVKQLEELQRQYQMMTYQYQAIAHVPRQVMSMGSALTSPTLQNPLPQASQFSGILSGNSLGPVTGLANTFASTDRYYEPTGGDAGATEMIRRRSSTSGIEAMAMNGIPRCRRRRNRWASSWATSAARRTCSNPPRSMRGWLWSRTTPPASRRRRRICKPWR